MKLGSIFLVAYFSTVALSWVEGNREGCIESLAELEYFESLATSYESLRRYILCENTVFEAGYLHPFYGTLVSRSSMLHLRPNLHIQCGASGARENNCRIRVGDVQVDGTSLYGMSEDPLTNVVIEGITFIDARKHIVFINKPGDVLFQDCVFRVSGKCSRTLVF